MSTASAASSSSTSNRSRASSQSRGSFWRYAIPAGRSKRNLALLRRHTSLRVWDQLQLRRCELCEVRTRLGRWWTEPPRLREIAGLSSLEEFNERLHSGEERRFVWCCRPCWNHWTVQNKQWFLRSDAGAAEEQEPSLLAAVSSSSGSAAGISSSREKRLSEPNPGDRHHFDFVEIGTSNYNTFTQAVASHPEGKQDAWRYFPKNTELATLRGLAVDMKRRYLDQLPDLPSVDKVCVAVAEKRGHKRMYHVRVRDIEIWEKVFSIRGSCRGYGAIHLARGCSALGKHSVLRRVLDKVGLRHLIRARSVRTTCISSLFTRHKVKSIGVLALDCEGHDCAILKGLLRACVKRPQWYPRWILFETNGMNDEVFGPGTERATVQQLLKLGYELHYGGGYHDTHTRDTVLQRMW